MKFDATVRLHYKLPGRKILSSMCLCACCCLHLIQMRSRWTCPAFATGGLAKKQAVITGLTMHQYRTALTSRVRCGKSGTLLYASILPILQVSCKQKSRTYYITMAGHEISSIRPSRAVYYFIYFARTCAKAQVR